MTAIDLPDLYSFELHFEDSAKLFLESATGSIVFVSGSQEDLVTPRIEISLDGVEAELPNNAPLNNLDYAEYTNHTATFIVAIVTDQFLEQPRLTHFDLVGKVRSELLRSSENWNKNNLPFYDLKFIRQSTTLRDVDGDFMRTEMNYDIRFAIRSDAFPT
jgi:hypothetical protein